MLSPIPLDEPGIDESGTEPDFAGPPWPDKKFEAWWKLDVGTGYDWRLAWVSPIGRDRFKIVEQQERVEFLCGEILHHKWQRSAPTDRWAHIEPLGFQWFDGNPECRDLVAIFPDGTHRLMTGAGPRWLAGEDFYERIQDSWYFGPDDPIEIATSAWDWVRRASRSRRLGSASPYGVAFPLTAAALTDLYRYCGDVICSDIEQAKKIRDFLMKPKSAIPTLRIREIEAETPITAPAGLDDIDPGVVA